MFDPGLRRGSAAAEASSRKDKHICDTTVAQPAVRMPITFRFAWFDVYDSERAGAKRARPMALTAGRFARFFETVPGYFLSKLPLGDGETGKAVLNERPLSVARIVLTSARVWA
jgi:hypothetical protein